MRLPIFTVSMHLLLLAMGAALTVAINQPIPNVPIAGSCVQVAAGCPGYLPPAPHFEFPHLIIPVSTWNPGTTYPNTLTPTITAGDMEAIFNFDIPLERQGQMCTLQFLLPVQSQLSTSTFRLAGGGSFIFSLSALGGGAVQGKTTFENRPLEANPHGLPATVQMQAGNAYRVTQTVCVPGQISVTMSSPDSNLTWFQDWNLCPIGLYITYSP